MKIKHTLLIALTSLLLAGCPGSEAHDRDQVQEQQEHYQKTQPIPRFDYSLERAVAIQLYEARNRKVTTWTIWRSDTGVIEGWCPSIGYPIPYDTSLTNPLQPYWSSNSSSIVEQAEPNGLFASHNSIATWVRCIVMVNDEEVEAPVYIESKVTAFPYPVTVDFATNRVAPVDGAAPSFILKTGEQRILPPHQLPSASASSTE